MSRTRRFLHGMQLGYLNQALITLVGIWLTPFLLRHLGQDQYGLWLTITQLLGYLVLLDLGVIAMVPRETAYAVGRGGGVEATREVAPLLGRTLRVVAWQMPVLVAGAAGLLLLLPARWEEARAVLVPILVIFVLCWPFRVFNAALEGLQQFRFTGSLNLALWTAQTAIIVALVAAGVGIEALAWGWGIIQVGAAVGTVLFLLRRFPQHLPRRLPSITRAQLREQLARGLWSTISQLTSTLIYTTDLIVIARLLGPAAAVPYALTAKLVLVLQNQPQLLIHAAMPGLSELVAAGDRARVARAMSALGLGLLVLSGAIATVVIVVNQGFVTWWVDAARFGGLWLTIVVALLMVARHWAVTMGYINFAFGGEKKLALVNLADGIVTVVLSVVLVRSVGIIGAPIASLAGALLISIPFGLFLLHRALGAQLAVVFQSMGGLLLRLMLLIVLAIAIAWRWSPHGPLDLALTALAAALVYTVVMLPIVARSTLAGYVLGHVPAPVARVLRNVGGFDPEPRPSAP